MLTKTRTFSLAAMLIALASAFVTAQQKKPSPDAYAATEIGGRYVGAEPTYLDGKWIEISYGGPIKRGRDLWGSGAAYGKMLYNGAPVWRAGADVSTYLMTQASLVINGKTIEPGGYSLFIDLKPNNWTFIVSSWQPQRSFNPANRDQLWGAFGYTPSKDIVRARMTLSTLSFSMDQLTWSFIDMSDAGGKFAIMWDRQMATVPFSIGK
jgi:Protein of unknown function (DUF2911)